MNIRRREALRSLEEDLGYLFERPDLLDQALVHRSYANEAGQGDWHNERLEFLGDAVLGLCVAQLLFEGQPHFDEGDMSRIRSHLVKEETLADVARSLGLGNHIRLGKGEEQSGGAEKPSILSDGFEALLGAIYIDGGFELAFRFIESIFQPVIDQAGSAAIVKDYKSRLQEYCQARYKKAPAYKQLSAEGPDHDRVFTVEIVLGARSLGKGAGRSKKEAEQDAARHALELLELGWVGRLRLLPAGRRRRLRARPSV
jgi:ribonuclease-3